MGKTKILEITGNWTGVLNRCRSTVSKEPLDKEPSEKFKREILIAEHNPIRFIRVSWEWRDVKSWIATHFARHIHIDKYISTQRDDRTGKNRDDAPQSAPVRFIGDGNVQALIDMMRKRLCGAAHRETRAYAEDLKAEIGKVEPEIAEVLIPNCVYRCGCPEMHSCGTWEKFRAWVGWKYGLDVRTLDIAGRNRMYDEF